MSYHRSNRLMYPLGDDLIDQAVAAVNPPPAGPGISSGAGVVVPYDPTTSPTNILNPNFWAGAPATASSPAAPTGVPNILRGTFMDPGAWSSPASAVSGTLTNPYIMGAALAVGVLVMTRKKSRRSSSARRRRR